MSDIVFTIPGEPQGKARPRVVRNTHTGGVHTHTPDKTVAYEELVRARFTQAIGNIPHYVPFAPLIIGAIRAEITACYAIPQSVSKTKRVQMLWGDIAPTKKPDADNIAKIILDALNGLAYKDDAQIVALAVRKKYAEVGSVTVKLSSLERSVREHGACPLDRI